ncbi:MAG TPA: TolC family protein, partial [Candidatus Agathobaculum merdigallinarum]|nr:TolC family protein [Candidatus Agathobaculum merdigallinarum]
MRLRNWTRRLTGLMAAAALLSAVCPPQAAAAEQRLLLAQAQALAVSNSSDISKQSNEITLQKMKYVEAVDAIKAKVKNLTSFRWTPLLSFKFPEKLNMTEEYDLQIKPITLQADITTMQHELEDLRYAALLEVNTAYLDAYILQEKVALTKERLETAREELERNQMRLRTGDATQADIDKMEKTVETLETELSTQMRNFETAKTNLSDIINMDVTTGYTFVNSLFTAAIPREELEAITTYTLENDQGYYAAKMSTSTALLNLNAY